MVIRRQQMETFARSGRESFAARQAERVRKKFPAETEPLDAGRLHRIIREGIAAAQAAAIDRELDLQRFIDLQFRIACDFHHAPWAETILQDRSFTAGYKLDQLEGQAVLLGLIEQ